MKRRFQLTDDYHENISLPIKDTSRDGAWYGNDEMMITEVVEALHDLESENRQLKQTLTAFIRSEFSMVEEAISKPIQRFKLDEDNDLYDSEKDRHYLCYQSPSKRQEFVDELNVLQTQKEYWKGRCKAVERIKQIEVEVEIDDED